MSANDTTNRPVDVPPSHTGVTTGNGGGTSGTGGGTSGTSGGPGGTPAPAASTGNFTVVSQRQTVQQLSSGSVIDVESVGFQTSPHNVYCEVLVPIADWQAGNSATYINPVATAIETLMSGQPVSSASFTQDVDPATNLLADFVSFVVYFAAPGAIAPMTSTVRVLVSDLANGAAGVPTALIQAAASSLQHTAGL